MVFGRFLAVVEISIWAPPKRCWPPSCTRPTVTVKHVGRFWPGLGATPWAQRRATPQHMRFELPVNQSRRASPFWPHPAPAPGTVDGRKSQSVQESRVTPCPISMLAWHKKRGSANGRNKSERWRAATDVAGSTLHMGLRGEPGSPLPTL